MLCKNIDRLMVLFIRTSCAHTTKHNGVIVRQNGHLLGVARAMMIHVHVPKYFFSDAILTSNQVPSSMRSGKNLIFQFFIKISHYLIHHPKCLDVFILFMC